MTAEQSGFFLVDKEKDWTSFDVVNKLRYMLKHHFGVKKLKVGHAGTLDPLATGLLIVCYGKMTKKIDNFQAMEKTYTGLIKLGYTTPSYDLETEFNGEFETSHITQELVDEVTKQLCGKQVQKAPMYSAKRVEGERLYNLAREGKVVKVKEHEIEVFTFNAKLQKDNLVSFEIICSKGTYIRSLANDFGKLLNSGAHLQELRRTAIGSHSVYNSLTIKEIEAEISNIRK